MTVRGMAEQDATKWKTVRTITAAARKALTASYDESIWNNRVVCPLLDAPVRREEEDLLSVYPMYDFPLFFDSPTCC